MGEPERTPKSEIVRHAFEQQAELCNTLGSQFTAALCRLLAGRLDDDDAVGREVLAWPGDPVIDALPLRLAGGLHALVLGRRAPALVAAYPPHPLDPERLWQAVSGALTDHVDELMAALGRHPQTNEVARSAILLPGFLTIARETARPLALLELGSSAGLNLLWDRFHYRYGEHEWGPRTSPVTLASELRGAIPNLGGEVKVTSRRGVDLAPADASNADDRLRLRSYVWADQRERLARLDGALDLARALAVRVDAGDAAAWLDAALAARHDGAATVVFHSIMWQYASHETQRRIEDSLERAGAAASTDRPLARLEFEGVAGRAPALLTLTQWPPGRTRILAEADFHGRWIDWRS
jgi:hypothetical protein